MLSKVGIVCYFEYIVICVCGFINLLAGGNKEIYLSIYTGCKSSFIYLFIYFFFFFGGGGSVDLLFVKPLLQFTLIAQRQLSENIVSLSAMW